MPLDIRRKIHVPTSILGFSIIALKLKKDDGGFVVSSGVQENKLWTLKIYDK